MVQRRAVRRRYGPAAAALIDEPLVQKDGQRRRARWWKTYSGLPRDHKRGRGIVLPKVEID